MASIPGHISIEVHATPSRQHADASPKHDNSRRNGVVTPPAWSPGPAAPSGSPGPPPRSASPGQLRLKSIMQDDVAGLAEYVGAVCSAQASQLQRKERDAYELQIVQLKERVGQLQGEVGQLRRLMPNGEVSFQKMYAELKVSGQEVSEWKRKHQHQVEIRIIAEDALAEAIGVVDELGLECDAIHTRFEQLQLMSEAEQAAAAAAAAAAKKKNEKSSWMGRWRQASRKEICLEVGLSLLALASAVVATYFITAALVAA